ncbi:MAG: hypothetical protein WD750_10870 [Gammaproteobacteria bacterium]
MPANPTEHAQILRQCKDYETLVASALYLMTRYLQTGDQTLSNAVAIHLAALSDHPDCPNACLAGTVRKLSEEWRHMNAVSAVEYDGGLH